jgi:quercetin dioxygenase-like cupin family protein
MRIFYSLLAFASVLTAGAAQNALKIENDQARILVVKSEADAKSALHEHKVNRVMIYLDAGKIILTEPGGRIETNVFKAGQALWSPATTSPHISHNVSGHAVRIVEVEIKEKARAAGKKKPSALDPLKVDAKRYKMEFENEQVRVFRARYAAHEKGVTHEHVLNRAVTFITDGNMKVTTPDGVSKILKASAGDVTWGGEAKHIEENLSGQPFEVVVVEFKE